MKVVSTALCARKLAPARTVLVSAVVLVIVGAFALSALAATTTVKVGDNYYVRDGPPPTLKVKRNDVVRWRFVGTNVHTVSVQGKAPERLESGVRADGVYRHTMKKRGTYRIYCRVHGAADQSMVLKVR
jgi:plastocyanin